MTDGSIAWFGLALELVVAAAYLSAALQRSARGSRWPLSRTAAFIAGLLVIAVALDSPVAAHDDIPSVHVLQHALLMMLAPMLLALGAPITLAMRCASDAGRRRLRAILHDPSVKGLVTRPGVLIADYNLTMALMLLAPFYRLAERSVVIHIAVHGYLVFCGLLFWSAILARDPVPGRLPEATRIHAAALAIPLNLALAVAIVLAPGVFVGSTGSAEMLIATTVTTTVLGIGVIPRRRFAPRVRPAVTTWPA